MRVKPDLILPLRTVVLVLLFSLIVTNVSAAPSGAENRALAAASKLFDDRFYSQAEKGASDFLEKYKDSERRADALLLLAKARFHQTNYKGAIEVLRDSAALAGALADRFYFWLGEAQFQSGDYSSAAKTYAQISERFPLSAVRFQACYNEAFSYSKLSDWARVRELLENKAGCFQQESAKQPNSDITTQGTLLLAEALLAGKSIEEVGPVLATLDGRTLPPALRWRQQYLLIRATLDARRPEMALEKSTNLVSLAVSAAERELVAQSFLLQAGILETLGRFTNAITVLENNLTDKTSVDLRKISLLRTVEILGKQNNNREALQMLWSFTGKYTNDAVSDFAFLALGEFSLREYLKVRETTNSVTLSDLGTNQLTLDAAGLLDFAATNFSRVVTEFPSSPALGKTHLLRGWCSWWRESWTDARGEFQTAEAKLGKGPDKTIAAIMLGDCEQKLGQFALAIQAYQHALNELAAVSDTNRLGARTFYELFRCALRVNDEGLAKQALRRLLDDYPNSLFADSSVLLFGQHLSDRGRASESRTLLREFIENFPKSEMRPELEFAIARTLLQDNLRAEAIGVYDQWITNHPGHLLLPKAEYSRALAYGRSEGTNALRLLTNFVASYPTNSLTPLSQNWIADYYFDQDDFLNAEKNYQLLFQNPATPIDLAYRARMMAGRSDIALQEFSTARDHFSKLVTLMLKDTNAPPDLLAQAWFALGDTIFSQFLADTNRPQDKFDEAITAFTRVTKDFSSNHVAALAWGRIGDCHRQAAIFDTSGFVSIAASNSLVKAATAYSTALTVPESEPSTRNQARVGLGLVAEKLNHLDEALGYFLAVIYQNENEGPDPLWVKEAGLGAGRICEQLGQWEKAIAVYKRVSQALPSLAPALDLKCAAARKNLSGP
jgi:TolA-binding protein